MSVGEFDILLEVRCKVSRFEIYFKSGSFVKRLHSRLSSVSESGKTMAPMEVIWLCMEHIQSGQVVHVRQRL